MEDISIAIIEDDQIISQRLKEYLSNQPEFKKVDLFLSVEEFMEQFNQDNLYNIILTDIGLPGMSGIEGISKIKVLAPSTDIIMITVYNDAEKIFNSLCAGAIGYLLKTTPFEEIKQTILSTKEGGSVMSPSIARKVMEFFQPKAKEFVLTQRENEIVTGLVDGLSYKMIAAKLAISIDTVRFHLRNIYKKLHVNSKSEVISKALKGEI